MERGYAMLKLKDILKIARSNIVIMKGIESVIEINNKFILSNYLFDEKVLNEKILNKKVNRIDTYNDRIRIWLEDEEND